MLVCFASLYLLEFKFRYLALFLLFSVLDGFEWFWMGSLYKKLLEFFKAPFLVLHFSYYTLMTFLVILSVILLSMPVICNIPIYADDTTFYCKCDQVSDLWQQLEVTSELESDLQDTMD